VINSIKFKMSWAILFSYHLHQIRRADSFCTIILCWSCWWEGEGKGGLSPWLAEGVGRETRARIATRTRNNILGLSCNVWTLWILRSAGS